MNAGPIAHLALVAATVLGAIPRLGRGLRVSVAPLGVSTPSDVVVTIDDPALADAALEAAFVRMRAALTGEGALVLVVGSPVTAGLCAATRSFGDGARAAFEARDDAFARAMMWASARAVDARRVVAPPIDQARLAELVAAASKSDWTLIEADLAVGAPGLARVRGMKSPRARALLTTIALGADARPLVFVPSERAPKGGLARAKVDRLVDGWVGAGVATPTEDDASELTRAALEVLADAARAARGPLPFKALLREARDRWTTAARASGSRATASASDAHDLAASLYRLAGSDRVDLWMLDPADPGWILTES